MHKNTQKISVVVPVYNEIEIIKQFHNQLYSTLKNNHQKFEIIYIDDNSTDGTYEWLQSISPDPHIISARKEGTKGKAYSLLEGFAIASGTVFVMIDGDLQYPPEKIPEMVHALAKADVVIANRKDYKDTKLRKLMSRGFRKIFGKMMFGLDTDIQSGLKVFTREVYETVKFTPVSAWTFDLEFLYRAKQAGFTYENIMISFAPRTSGSSKMNVMRQSYEIGANALYVKLHKQPYFPVVHEEGSMRGAGLTYKGKKYVTHTTLPIAYSAVQTFSLSQKIFFIASPIILIIALIFIPLETARWIVAVLSILYFIDAVFNFYVVSKSLQKDHEIDINDEETIAIDESTLPIYTILCPLYKEVHVVPQFLEGISKLDWPKEKLDVMFLLEEDDTETIEAFERMHLPFYTRVIVVPDSQPKTKPKACNYGLSYAKGKYLVIYDAEDIPDPLQLKKAYLGFRKAPTNVKCLQAKLSYYNSRQNLLTRFFTAEYALWFDITLPGLQSLNSALPLGGTSNHFETDNLKKLHGWDPFNVTEDADLGIRLFQQGYRTAIINSTTYEEATSLSKNWLRQRSRWIKGYMQTYLVHMRNNVSFIKQKGLWHNFVFQLTVGGKILFVLLNPFMWIITVLYFAANSIVGPTMEAIYQAPISYIAVASWIFGNFIFMYCYMIAAAKRQQWDIMKYVLLIPLYWFMMSTAAMVALYQLILKPHYWEKTLHGFHLGRKKDKALKPTAKIAPIPTTVPAFSSPKLPIKNFKLPRLNVTFSAVIGVLPLLTLLNIDLVLAKLYLPYDQAQTYLLLSLLGKAIFIVNQLGSRLATSIIARGNTEITYFYKLIFFTFLFHWAGFTALGLQAEFVIPALFSNTFNDVIPYMSFYMFAMLCFGLAARFNDYKMKNNNYVYSFISLAIMWAFIPLIAFNNETITQFVSIFAYLASINLLIVGILFFGKPYVHILENNISSLIALFDKSRSRRVWKENQMRILIFNWRDTKHIYAGGAEVYIDELAKRWAANGNKVTIFCGNDNRNAFYERVNGIEVYRRGGTYTVYVFAIIYYLFKFRGKYDVIVDCENGIPFFMPLFAKEQVILLIHHVHQEIFRKFLKFPMSTIAKILEGKVMPFIYQNKHVVTVSTSSQKDVFNIGFTNAGNISIIPNGVSSDLYVDYPKTDHPSYIYLGRLKEYKNIDVAINAFANVLKIHKDAKLSIVGSGESYPDLLALTQELQITDAVTFYGKVSEKDKAMMLAQSWAAIQPSQMEGWGITVIEANAAGTPVIASNVKGLQDSVVDKHTGLLVEAGNVDGFADAMQLIVEDAVLRMTLSQQARVWSQNFDWDKSANAFYKIIGRNFGQGAVTPAYSNAVYSRSEKGGKNS